MFPFDDVIMNDHLVYILPDMIPDRREYVFCKYLSGTLPHMNKLDEINCRLLVQNYYTYIYILLLICYACALGSLNTQTQGFHNPLLLRKLNKTQLYIVYSVDI